MTYKKHFGQSEITKKEFEDAYQIANDLVKKLKGNESKLKVFTEEFLRKMLEELGGKSESKCRNTKN